MESTEMAGRRAIVGVLWAVFRSVALCGLLALAVCPAGSVADNTSPDIATDARSGLVTAVFPNRTDDAALLTAMPALVAHDVQSITLRDAVIHDLRPLAQLPNLVALNLRGTQVRDLTPLRQLTRLQELNLQFLPVTDLRPLAALLRLHSLTIAGTDVRDLSPLAGLTELQTLKAAVTKVRDLTPLLSLRALTSLDLGETEVRDLAPLAGLMNLRVLTLNGTLVRDINPLAGMTAMEVLDLGGTQVADLRPLARLTALRTLNLEGTGVADLSPLSRMTRLQTLALGGSQVKDLRPLAALPIATTFAQPQDPMATDPVLLWNDQTNRSIQRAATDAFEASRILALESIAVMDVVRSIDSAPGFLVRLPAPPDIRPEAAVAAAAHAVLARLFPSQKAPLDAALANALTSEPNTARRARSVAFGEAVAESVMMMRANDMTVSPARGSHAETSGRSGPGAWQPTPPDYQPAMHPDWATMTPFALTDPAQFRPAGPPVPESDSFRDAMMAVARLGGTDSTARTAEQTEIAHYWSDAIGTYAPAGHWNAITAALVQPLRLGMKAEAELFAELNIALADAGIAMADAKYAFWEWRPVTAIHAGIDGAAPAPAWTPLLETPNHPSYISGHSAFSAAAAAVLTARLGARPFTFASESLPGVRRSFASFEQAAEEAAMSRVYGGIHFPFDNADGLATGRAVGNWTLRAFQRLTEDRGPFLMAETAGGHVEGCALDNLSPVRSVTVRVDGGNPFSIPVNERGLWALPPAAGRHRIVLAATSLSGRSMSVQMDVGDGLLAK